MGGFFFEPMKKALFVIAGLVILASCGPKDKRFCSCMDESAKYNELAEKYSKNGFESISDKEIEEVTNLRATKDSICSPYEMLGAEELIKLRESCGIKSDLE